MHYPGADGGPLERWPGAARGWNLAKIDASAERSSEVARSVEALRILQPADQSEFLLTGEANGDRIRLRASLEERNALHWYANDRYLGQSQPGEPFLYDLTAGAHKLTCLAPGGAHRSVHIQVHDAESAVRMQ
jgi:membrane carboxypeptidase/penicillin-binding protein PbpC